MTRATTTSLGRAAALALILLGALAVLGSISTWATCPTTPCGGILQAISEYSGIDLGFGILAAAGGLALIISGIAVYRGADVDRWAPVATAGALFVAGAVAAAIVWMYLIPGDEKEYHWPPIIAILVGIVGVIALGASRRLRS